VDAQVAARTIDERIDDILDRKEHVQKFLLGDIQDYLGLEKVTLSDMKRLLGR